MLLVEMAVEKIDLALEKHVEELTIAVQPCEAQVPSVILLFGTPNEAAMVALLQLD